MALQTSHSMRKYLSLSIERVKLKQPIQILIAALPLGELCLQSAMAHGHGKPQHGGFVQVVSDVYSEILPEAVSAAIYLAAKSKPMTSKGIAVKLMLLHGSRQDRDSAIHRERRF